MKIIAKQDTLLKKSTEQSSSLSANQFVAVKQGKEYLVTELQDADKGHSKVVLGYGAGTWFIYSQHWTIITDKIDAKFPNGLPRPVISPPFTQSTVVSSITEYCNRVNITEKGYQAYILSTAENEANFKPIKEYRGKTLTRDQEKYWASNYMGRGLITSSL